MPNTICFLLQHFVVFGSHVPPNNILQTTNLTLNAAMLLLANTNVLQQKLPQFSFLYFVFFPFWIFQLFVLHKVTTPLTDDWLPVCLVVPKIGSCNNNTIQNILHSPIAVKVNWPLWPPPPILPAVAAALD